MFQTTEVEKNQAYQEELCTEHAMMQAHYSVLLEDLKKQSVMKDKIISEQGLTFESLKKYFDDLKQVTSAQIATQAKASNSVISQQSRSLEELRRVIEVSKQEVMAEAQAEMHKQIQRVQVCYNMFQCPHFVSQFKVEKENELLKLRDHYETLAHLKEVWISYVGRLTAPDP